MIRWQCAWYHVRAYCHRFFRRVNHASWRMAFDVCQKIELKLWFESVKERTWPKIPICYLLTAIQNWLCFCFATITFFPTTFQCKSTVGFVDAQKATHRWTRATAKAYWALRSFWIMPISYLISELSKRLWFSYFKRIETEHFPHFFAIPSLIRNILLCKYLFAGVNWKRAMWIWVYLRWFTQVLPENSLSISLT